MLLTFFNGELFAKYYTKQSTRNRYEYKIYLKKEKLLKELKQFARENAKKDSRWKNLPEYIKWENLFISFLCRSGFTENLDHLASYRTEYLSKNVLETITLNKEKVTIIDLKSSFVMPYHYCPATPVLYLYWGPLSKSLALGVLNKKVNILEDNTHILNFEESNEKSNKTQTNEINILDQESNNNDNLIIPSSPYLYVSTLSNPEFSYTKNLSRLPILYKQEQKSYYINTSTQGGNAYESRGGNAYENRGGGNSYKNRGGTSYKTRKGGNAYKGKY